MTNEHNAYERHKSEWKSLRDAEMKRLKIKINDTRRFIEQYKDDPSRSQDLTQSRIE